MKLLATLLISTLIAPGVGLSMDQDNAQANQDEPEYQQQQKDHERDRHGRQKQLGQRTGTQERFLTAAPIAGVSMEHIIGSDVKNRSNNETIGTVEDILIDHTGRPQAAVIAVDQVLGIGEKDVALNWNNIEVRAEGEDHSMMGRANDVRQDPMRNPQDPVRNRQDPMRDRGADETGAMTEDNRRPGSAYANLTPRDYVLVVDLSEDDLEDAPEFDRANWNE